MPNAPKVYHCDHCGKQITDYSQALADTIYNQVIRAFCSWQCWKATPTKAQQERRDWEYENCR